MCMYSLLCPACNLGEARRPIDANVPARYLERESCPRSSTSRLSHLIMHCSINAKERFGGDERRGSELQQGDRGPRQSLQAAVVH